MCYLTVYYLIIGPQFDDELFLSLIISLSLGIGSENWYSGCMIVVNSSCDLLHLPERVKIYSKDSCMDWVQGYYLVEKAIGRTFIGQRYSSQITVHLTPNQLKAGCCFP
jgi:hypothetical protein